MICLVQSFRIDNIKIKKRAPEVNRKDYAVVGKKRKLWVANRRDRVETFILFKMITKLIGQKYTSIAKSW